MILKPVIHVYIQVMYM